jgi:hypothetical protein
MGSINCAEVTVMNAGYAQGQRYLYPNRVLRRLNRLGPTTTNGTSERAMDRDAVALGMRPIPLRHNFERARRLTQRGVPVGMSLNPERLPMWLQLTRGGPFESDPAGHEALIHKIGPFGGALVEDPQIGWYRLGPGQLRRAVGWAGDLTGLSLRGS